MQFSYCTPSVSNNPYSASLDDTIIPIAAPPNINTNNNRTTNVKKVSYADSL
ncbi:hypothetical protein RCG17_14235 [Neobacillus sp. PS3-12]|uniref:hypothetical protein n=1 Tax=Neobacillus sp. PS3-12 TaxID=3070677 RepID=UPI0027E17556|nr:hypothetical protein [Neobacillus sp. PS3-12]WML55602.1 hypothetical protein RCG17_14235 [Neobacillus sp. PS3-12]